MQLEARADRRGLRRLGVSGKRVGPHGPLERVQAADVDASCGLRAVLPRPRARVCAPRRPLAPSGASACSAPSSRALGPWLRGRARSTRFRSRSRPSLGGAGTRLRMRCLCRPRDSQSRAAQGHSVAADGAWHGGDRVAGRTLRWHVDEWPRMPFGRVSVAVRSTSRVVLSLRPSRNRGAACLAERVPQPARKAGAQRRSVTTG